MKPGWLPTAVVVNILTKDDKRREGKRVHSSDLVDVKLQGDGPLDDILLPTNCKDASWRPRQLAPIEVIDGQHRLWAFDHLSPGEDFELPVVAYHGLDLGWQAYLFWSINIKPTKISKSLGFDLYPLLRSEEWLENSGDLRVYREARAQELVQALWAHDQSPWYRRINLLGEPGMKVKMVNQSSWIRGLTTSLLRAPQIKDPRKGGLFTSPIDGGLPLEWSGAQEAAFLIFAGREMRRAVTETNAEWAKELRNEAKSEKEIEWELAPFYGRYALLATDQGVGGFLLALNDVCLFAADELDFGAWKGFETSTLATNSEEVTRALKELPGRMFGKVIAEMCTSMAEFDWRLSSFPGFTDKEKTEKQAFRGAGGYPLIKRGAITHLKKASPILRKAAQQILASEKE